MCLNYWTTLLQNLNLALQKTWGYITPKIQRPHLSTAKGSMFQHKQNTVPLQSPCPQGATAVKPARLPKNEDNLKHLSSPSHEEIACGRELSVPKVSLEENQVQYEPQRGWQGHSDLAIMGYCFYSRRRLKIVLYRNYIQTDWYSLNEFLIFFSEAS